MNPELLTCRHLTAGLIYPPLNVGPTDLNRIYARITEKYPYQSLQHIADGVRMANPDGDCFIQINRMQINENVMYFQSSKAKFMAMFRLLQESLGVTQFLNLGVKLTAFLPFDEPGAAAAFLESKAFALNSGQWDVLGGGRSGAGFRVLLHQNAVRDLKIEPFFNDTSQLYVEVDNQYVEPTSDFAEIDARLDDSYDFMFSKVRGFLASLR
jgi:hypothetical protein